MKELHRHLEAALSIPDLRSFVIQYDINLPREEGALREVVTFRSRPGDLMSFLKPFEHIQNCFVSFEAIRDYSLLAVKRLYEEGISYAELRFSPFYMAGIYSGEMKVAPQAVVEAVLEGCKEGERRWPVRVGIVLIVARDLDVKNGHTVIDLALK